MRAVVLFGFSIFALSIGSPISIKVAVTLFVTLGIATKTNPARPNKIKNPIGNIHLFLYRLNQLKTAQTLIKNTKINPTLEPDKRIKNPINNPAKVFKKISFLLSAISIFLNRKK